MMGSTVFQSPTRPLMAAHHTPRVPPRGATLKASAAVVFMKKNSVPKLETTSSPPDQRDALEHCFNSCSTSSFSSPVAVSPVMKKNFGSMQSVTLDKPKFEQVQRQKTTAPPEIATGGGSGLPPKKNSHGGGDGGDDDGDDDDYFGDFDDGEEGEEGGFFRRRLVLLELFDKKYVDAVVQEWCKTMADLPAGIRQAYEMGLVSSAQMVRLLSINARPTISRLISRSLPQSISRAFIGRMIADPSFLYKLLLEQATTISRSVWWELKTRKESIKQEWDLALVNILTASACNAIVVWSLAPCRSYGNTFRFDLQNTIQKLPNNIFEKSYPIREFDLQKRIHSFFYKVAEFCLVGLTAGSIQGAALKFLSAKKEGRLSVTVPSVSTNALGYGAFLGLYANLRYQLLCGADRVMLDHFDVLGVVIFFSTALRILNVEIGERSKLAWLGVEADPLVQSDNLLKAYNRPSETTSSHQSSNWDLLGLLGIKQKSGETPAITSKARRKRVVKRKIVASSP